jgi:tetratricopeptide (TPR) repeat protein/energy-coupling factor transporter ATP-binding protein EcfA2
LEAYRKADELGDAEAALELGEALLQKGDVVAARGAYERAEARGHRDAGLCLGNLSILSGDRAGAKTAWLRSIERGSVVASLNMGVMLVEDGEIEEALVHLQRAADGGFPRAFLEVGKIREQQGNWAAAVESYRHGADLGDAACAFGLGMSLYKQGDLVGSRAAFKHAQDLGDDRAAGLLEALDHEENSAGSEGAGLNVGELWSNVTGIYEALAAERKKLGRQWIAATLAVQEKQAQLAALKAADDHIRDRFTTICDRFGRLLGAGRTDFFGSPIPASSPSEWLSAQSGQAGSWSLTEAQAKAFDTDLQEAQRSWQETNGRFFVGWKRRDGLDALGRVAKRLDALEDAIDVAGRDITETEQSRERESRAAVERSRDAFNPIASLAASSALDLPAILQPWSSPSWESWSLNDGTNLGLRLAYGGVLTPKRDEHLGPNAGFGTDLRIPWGFALHNSWHLVHDVQSRAAAHGFVRSMMLRQLLSVSPGEVKFCIFDPVGLGQSAGDLLDLAEYDADLIGGKVWSSPHDWEIRLVELSSHIELVIQKYLRTTYQTIDEFNDAAGEVAEPYRMLVLFDSPTGLTADSASRLKSIVENGPRCGVFTLMATDSSVQAPYGVDLERVTTSMSRLNPPDGFVDTVNDYQLETEFEHDVLPERSEAAKRVIDSVGRASIHRIEAAVTFDKVFAMYGNVAARGLRPELGTAATRTKVGDPKTWWSEDSTRGLFAPIGQKGARDVAILGFDSSDHAGALLVGRPGSGKSTLLHAYVGGLTTLYGPEELELYLIDFKEGVEFKAYAEEQLPQAKVIAIESDREFGLSVLESLQAEIAQRAEVLRATGGRQAGLQGLREATGEKIPRVLLVFDEFQVLFARNDRVGLAAADLLESIIRQGRGFGVHVLLGSQSLAGLDALGAHVPQLLPVRILLPAAESDARKVLGDTNNAGDYLNGHGEGILNAAGGAVEANERFKGALLAESDRVARLQVMRDKANEAGFTRVPMVFEGNSLVPLDNQNPHQFREELTASGTYPIRVRSGAPMTVGAIGDLVLPREGGANVLAIVRGGDNQHTGIDAAGGPAYGLLAAAVASGAMTNSAVDVIDFMSNDDGLDELFEPLLDARRITLKRRRAFPDVLEEYVGEVAKRVEQDDTSRPAKLLFLFGIHRARDLDAELGSLDVDGDLVEKLERVMRDGPEVGVHVWLWADSVAGASRRLTPRMMRELGWRIAGKMSGDDSLTFIGTVQAADLRESQLLMTNEDRGVSTRVIAYAPPSRAWVAQVAGSTTRNN